MVDSSRVSRRTLLSGAVGGAVAGVASSVVGAGAAGASGGERPLIPVSMAPHIHASFSEGVASFGAHLQQARQHGIDVIWWTDHDFRVAAHDHREAVRFEGPKELEGPLEWTWAPRPEGALAATAAEFVDEPHSPGEEGKALRLSATGGPGGGISGTWARRGTSRTARASPTPCWSWTSCRRRPPRDAVFVVQLQLSYHAATRRPARRAVLAAVLRRRQHRDRPAGRRAGRDRRAARRHRPVAAADAVAGPRHPQDLARPGRGGQLVRAVPARRDGGRGPAGQRCRRPDALSPRRPARTGRRGAAPVRAQPLPRGVPRRTPLPGVRGVAGPPHQLVRPADRDPRAALAAVPRRRSGQGQGDDRLHPLARRAGLLEPSARRRAARLAGQTHDRDEQSRRRPGRDRPHPVRRAALGVRRRRPQRDLLHGDRVERRPRRPGLAGAGGEPRHLGLGGLDRPGRPARRDAGRPGLVLRSREVPRRAGHPGARPAGDGRGRRHRGDRGPGGAGGHRRPG